MLDDLHAADPSSLLLLQFLVRDLRSAPLVVIGTYREAEARLSPDVSHTLTQVAREATVLPLRRLDRDEVADFVAQSTGSAPSAEQVGALHQRTEGNPLFLRELLRLQRATVGEPEGIREVVRARLALLTAAVRRPLEAAAVLGREFDLDPLAVLAEMTPLELSALLTPAADAGIVEPLEQAGAGASRTCSCAKGSTTIFAPNAARRSIARPPPSWRDASEARRSPSWPITS